ncbi:Protein of unknown function (DUF4412) [Desulfocurvibacter africanus PCS]|uniref:DUF4412 domain-containing protein n=1 Tax=Desulfocurvibacter africanus PCS TaxID=1262666 RepID=M5PPD1_DESAF|nr:DUF4412 domain-containing protein [Desulfocurvibacter africanus]EMG36112.1 Protein of unknown function (DUF4412) [Desulfocurvibacter africanus PCS]
MSRLVRSMLCLGILAMTVSLACASIAQAGFIQTEDDGSALYVQNGKLRGETSEEGDMWSVIDMTKGTIMMVNPDEKTYYEGTIDEYCAGMRTMMDAMSQFMGGLMPEPEQKKIKVEVVKAGPGGMIAGYDTTLYKVLVDGVLREELWMANDKALMKEVGDTQAMAKFSQCVAMETEFEASAEYQGLMKAGWPLKTVTHSGSEPETDSEVVSIEKADIPASKFAAPTGYSKTPMTDMFGPLEQ